MIVTKTLLAGDGTSFTGKFWDDGSGHLTPITRPAEDQDPIFDCTAGQRRTNVTASTLLITPPAGCKYIRVSADREVFVRTDGGAAADNGQSIAVGIVPETIPVTEGVAVNVFSTTAAIVRVMPYKNRV